MAVPLSKFAQQLEESGILAGETLSDFLPPKSDPKDAESLARELIRNRKLTKFQAEEVSKGKGKSLTLGNYVLVDRIGAGGMGQVFKAEHRRMKRMVAIKLLPSALTQDEQAIARFEREVEAAAKLSHPNIVAAHDADFANGVHFLVMELVEGSDLSALVKKKGVLPVGQAVNYIVQAARGLAAAHAEGIIHRDIKPANLLLDRKGTVKILDMGLARLHGDVDGPTQAELTASGAVMGTVDYMAPEQALSTKTADARADIYGLGCSLYYLLTAKPLYEGETLMSKLLAHRDEAIPSLRTARPEVPDALDAVFQKMVAKRVQDRYQTVSELLVDVEQLETSAPGPTNGRQSAVGIKSAQSRSTARVDENTVVPGSEIQLLSATSAKAKTRAIPAASRNGRPPAWKNTWGIVGAAAVGLTILAGIIVSLKTKDGTLTVEIDQPDATVQVLNAEGKVEVSQKGGAGTVSISVDPGKHRLKVEKEGFAVFGQDFELASGGKTPITAKLVPLETKPESLPIDADPERVVAEWAIQKGGMVGVLVNGMLTDYIKSVDRLPREPFHTVHLHLFRLPAVTDTDMLRLGDLKELRFLSVSETGVTSSGLLSLRKLKLQQLGIGGKPLDADTLSALTHLTTLRGLELAACEVTDDDVAVVKSLPNVTSLALSWNNLSAPLFIRLGELTRLQHLSLSNTNFDEAQLRHLQPLINLKFLELENTATTDAGLAHLSKLSSLANLSVSGTKVTEQGIADFKQLLPKCKVTWKAALNE